MTLPEWLALAGFVAVLCAIALDALAEPGEAEARRRIRGRVGRRVGARRRRRERG